MEKAISVFLTSSWRVICSENYELIVLWVQKIFFNKWSFLHVYRCWGKMKYFGVKGLRPFMKKSIIVTCEHGGREVPDDYLSLFNGFSELLNSHRGWDPGALEMATVLSKRLHAQTVTRLLIEMNRSIDNAQLFSEFVAPLSSSSREYLKTQYYFPYRRPVEDFVASALLPVLHLSIHSFTPSLNGQVRNVDIGLLFDPGRNGETLFCNELLGKLKSKFPTCRIAFNEPYLGTDDGFTTNLRKQFPDEHYAGIEIEVNQRHVNTPQWNLFSEALSEEVAAIVR